MMSPDAPTVLPAETPRRPRTHALERVAAAAVLLLGALGLLLVGGGFLVGVLAVVRGPDVTPDAPHALSAGESDLVRALYVLAFLSFGGALVLLSLAVVGLCRILWQRQVPS